jgi:hypothetical protein
MKFKLESNILISSGSNTENAIMNNPSPKCAECPMRKQAEAKPKSFMARLWKWHTTWCPGWKSYQQHLKTQSQAS